MLRSLWARGWNGWNLASLLKFAGELQPVNSVNPAETKPSGTNLIDQHLQLSRVEGRKPSRLSATDINISHIIVIYDIFIAIWRMCEICADNCQLLPHPKNPLQDLPIEISLRISSSKELFLGTSHQIISNHIKSVFLDFKCSKCATGKEGRAVQGKQPFAEGPQVEAEQAAQASPFSPCFCLHANW